MVTAGDASAWYRGRQRGYQPQQSSFLSSANGKAALGIAQRLPAGFPAVDAASRRFATHYLY
ncbi:hypothetical protein D3C78_992610 [compost metagenome]